MNEERTPIEELINQYQSEVEIYEHEHNHICLEKRVIIKHLKIILEADKAHREKYKHTKEDVIEGMKWQFNQTTMHYNSETSKPIILDIEQYYNETHENK